MKRTACHALIEFHQISFIPAGEWLKLIEINESLCSHEGNEIKSFQFISQNEMKLIDLHAEVEGTIRGISMHYGWDIMDGVPD